MGYINAFKDNEQDNFDNHSALCLIYPMWPAQGNNKKRWGWEYTIGDE